MRKRLFFVLFEAHTSVLEFFLAVVLIAVGLWFLNPTDTFSSSVSYVYMRHLAPEWLWGTGLFITGLLHLYGLIGNYRKLRLAFLSLSTFIWISMAGLFFQANPFALGDLMFTLIAFGCSLCLMRPEKLLIP